MELEELKTELESKLKDAKDPKEIESLTARVESIQSAEDLIARQAPSQDAWQKPRQPARARR